MEKAQTVSLCIGIPIILMLVGLTLMGLAVGEITVSKEFDKACHGHMENAYWSNTPELMIKELELYLDGIEELGIEEDDYGAFFSWDKTPDKRVSFWIEHVEGIINRTYSVISWRDQAYKNGSTPESLGDVYEQKMDNLRGFLKQGGWSDETVKDAYIIESALWWYFYPVIAIIMIIIIIIIITGTIILMMYFE